MNVTYTQSFETPIDLLWISGEGTESDWVVTMLSWQPLPGEQPWPSGIGDVLTQGLNEYFQTGCEQALRRWPLRLVGTDFQQSVWQACQAIPTGQTWTYGELARHIDRPKASQAIGQALKRNPFPLIIPCHRVVGQSKVGNIGINQNMGGYMGELDSPIKTFLLTHEGGIDSRVEQLAS